MVIQKIMVFKPLEELPNAFKFLPGFIPGGNEKVVVLEQIPDQDELYLKVRFKGGVSVINSRNFKTVR